MATRYGVLSVILLGISLMAGEPDEPDVRKVVADFTDTWDRHDAKAMAALHTEDVNFINIFGEWWKTRSERVLNRCGGKVSDSG